MSEWSNRAHDAAAAKNLDVHRPAPNELFIDIDDAASLAVFHENIGILGDFVIGFERSPSPSGKPDRFHIRVKCKRNLTDDNERVALQALLGSDRKHEILSWKAAWSGVIGVTVFFERKPGAPEL